MEPTSSFAGDLYTLPPARMYPKPVQARLNPVVLKKMSTATQSGIADRYCEQSHGETAGIRGGMAR